MGSIFGLVSPLYYLCDLCACEFWLIFTKLLYTTKITKHNASTIFQRCMMLIFSDLVEEVMEIFMDDFFVYGSSFGSCLENLAIVLQRCKEKNLALNWEKCHFMVTEGIVLGHKISTAELEVNQAKVSIIRTLMPPTTVKEVRSFLGHVGFYRRFIKYFSKISRPLCRLLEKDANFEFDEACMSTFEDI